MKNISLSCLVILFFVSSSGISFAQFGGNTPAETIYPPQNFNTAEEHYLYLLDQASGGTQHTLETIPVWDGLWVAAYNNMPGVFMKKALCSMQ